ncbi:MULTISPECIES: type I-C CRISPR-associated protein Cas8c/Csd1 [unclassified Modicisalibacter]|uniref:type I-C CRISPR-associated protein Cas8c/Csd1 n=1 Tax=unclassified Modicisalibacter TaxID=2679913 RepID=UPI001CCBBA64|nr:MULTISPECIES: type I-C CRISPR-associated protein Cas8c/Csd1 [unclassified Modicisalibacter]MBZ9558375.1 type I-C CRISPR-associated protein Cas8c/Csd1 [Modicisalibacter sp. R2A 31.J]MBZ9575733.1 type I-C CRISPR-associated protein Cas8c/Csd1 [Modicisalibacter sp. MOD 31.J]
MILSALNDYYQRLAADYKVPLPGFSSEKISYALVFSAEGVPLQVVDLRDTSGKKPRPRAMQVPVDKGRTSGIHAYPLWDKTAYALGVTNGTGKRLSEEHAAFKARQIELFGENDDPVLQAFLRLIERWRPEALAELPGYTEEMLDTNVVFRLDGERQYLHETLAAREIWQAALQKEAGDEGQCLITGEIASLGTDHPRIREVNGAQSSGASLVSFNSDAYESYGYKGQTNASISKTAIFGYATALNYLLRRDNDNHQRLQIGDATVVFWAEASDAAHAEAAENFLAMANAPPDDEQEAAKLGSLLTQVAQGRPLKEIDPILEPRTRMFVLGLAPNAARLSVRFWYADTLDELARHYAQHHRDMALEPTPWKGIAPGSWWLVLQTAPMHGGQRPKADDVPPQLAGELMRAILTGSRYPQSLLSNLVMRFRSDGHITGARIALCKAVLARAARLATQANSTTQEVPVSLDRHSTHPGYLLGRLFAELENAQRGALGNQLNATIRDRYYGAASATPASVFPMLLRNAQHHLSNLRKQGKGGLAHTIEDEIGAIIGGLGDTFPRHLKIEDQGRFAIGYYHQSQARFSKREPDTETTEETTAQGEGA